MKTIARPKTGVLLRSRSLLLLSDHYEHALRFEHEGDPHLSIRVPRDRWEDMGRPNQITVTIEPGSKVGDE